MPEPGDKVRVRVAYGDISTDLAIKMAQCANVLGAENVDLRITYTDVTLSFELEGKLVDNSQQ